MTCTLIGMYLMCSGVDPIAIYDRNTPAAHARPAQIDYDKMYRSLGMKTNYEYFCGSDMNPMDREMCAGIRPRR